jgi:hypothetical protein
MKSNTATLVVMFGKQNSYNLNMKNGQMYPWGGIKEVHLIYVLTAVSLYVIQFILSGQEVDGRATARVWRSQ